MTRLSLLALVSTLVACGGNGGADLADIDATDLATSAPDLACTPSCKNATCGDDGCGGSCGSCDQLQACTAAKTCSPSVCDITNPSSCLPGQRCVYLSTTQTYCQQDTTATTCVDPDSCEASDANCGGGAMCLQGVCQIECNSQAECRSNELCVLESGGLAQGVCQQTCDLFDLCACQNYAKDSAPSLMCDPAPYTCVLGTIAVCVQNTQLTTSCPSQFSAQDQDCTSASDCVGGPCVNGHCKLACDSTHPCATGTCTPYSSQAPFSYSVCM